MLSTIYPSQWYICCCDVPVWDYKLDLNLFLYKIICHTYIAVMIIDVFFFLNFITPALHQ